MKKNLFNLREEYSKGELSVNKAYKDPFELFDHWFDQCIKSNVPEPNAMSLATVGKNMQPSVRIVLLKSYNNMEFTFFTNYESRKGTELLENPRCALLFFWQALERQVRIEGTVKKVSEAESDAYFLSRPEKSRLGAWASPQSKVIEEGFIEANLNKLKTHMQKKIVERPSNWGGYSLQPNYFEFWQGRPDRLHDRAAYFLTNNKWELKRLAP
ncbi:MAG: pyridoxamine 5'-phosphate oxidase [Bacteroidales bacterium]|nr:pyridoxamine 5'-phosphate oxidase [Bacteroidales bacterium]